MRFVLSCILCVMFVAFGIQFYRLNAERVQLEERLSELRSRLTAADQEEAALRADLRYFREERNRLKAARALNFRAPGEELMVIIPQTER